MWRAVRVALVLSAIALGWYIWGRLVPDDEAAIRALLDRVAEGAGARGQEAAVAEDLDPDITVEAGPPFQRIHGREAVVATAARVNKALLNLEIVFKDVEITFDDDRQRAQAALTAEAYFMMTPGARRFDVRELVFELRRSDDRWVVAGVSRVSVLKPIGRP